MSGGGSERIPRSATIRVPLYAVLSADHYTPATGKTIAITISQNGAAFANPSGGATNATEIGSGWYYVDLSTTDTGTLGPLIIIGNAATIDQTSQTYDVVVSPQPANVTQWASGAVPAPNVTGVPLVDVKYTLGTLSAGAAGYMGIDWAHVANPGATVNLSGTTISGQNSNPTININETITILGQTPVSGSARVTK